MHVMDDAGIRHVFSVHGISNTLDDAVAPIRDYWAEGRAAAAVFARPTRDDLDAYDPGDPKRVSLERDL
jgi:hypothetical protein